jgi:hypothetical protein
MSERPDELAKEPQRGYNEEEEQEAYERERSSEDDGEEQREEDRNDGEVTESAAPDAGTL